MITVVIAIIAILASMLLPTLNKARDKAQSTACVNNLKQISTAIMLYGNGEWFPPRSGATNADQSTPNSWEQFVVSTLGGDGAHANRWNLVAKYLTCPTDKNALVGSKKTRLSYAFNAGSQSDGKVPYANDTSRSLAANQAFRMDRVKPFYSNYKTNRNDIVLLADRIVPHTDDGRDANQYRRRPVRPVLGIQIRVRPSGRRPERAFLRHVRQEAQSSPFHIQQCRLAAGAHSALGTVIHSG